MSDQGRAEFRISSVVDANTDQGMVRVALGDQASALLTLDDARAVAAALQAAIEAAVSDAMIFRWVIEKVGVEREQAASLLQDFREMRVAAPQAPASPQRPKLVLVQ